MTAQKDSAYFSLQAFWGITKHVGGLKATESLIGQSHIEPGSHVLVVGCGTGKTVTHLARKYDCRVAGIDISEDMVRLSRRRAAKEGVDGRTDFRTADAQSLPFPDDAFDAVISESVNVFIPDKLRAMREYLRVVKPGRYVGFNEITWLSPPTPRITEYFMRTMAARPLDADAWKALMKTAGLRNIEARVFHPGLSSMWCDEMKQLGIRDVALAWGRFLGTMMRWSPETREFLRATWPPPWNVLKYMGYGIYSGRK